METKNNFPEIYKGKADLSKYGFSQELISEIDERCMVLHSFYNKGQNPEDDRDFKIIVMKLQIAVFSSVEEKHEIDYHEGYFYEYTEEAKKSIKGFYNDEAEIFDNMRKQREENPELARKIDELAFRMATGW